MHPAEVLTCNCFVNSIVVADDAVVVIARILTSVVYLAVAGCFMWTWYCFTRLGYFSLVKATLMACGTTIRRALGKLRHKALASAPDSYAVKVRVVKLKMREERCGLFVKFITCYSLAWLIVDVLEFQRASVWSSDLDVESLRRTLLNRMVFPKVVSLAITFFLRTRSYCFIANAIHLHFLFSSVAQLWFFTDLQQYYSMVATSNSLRLVMAAMLGRTRFVAVLSGLYWGCQFARGKIEPIFDDGLHTDAIMFFLCVAAAEFTERSVQSMAEANVAAESSACGEVAVQKLLGIMCDAVVHLDANLVVYPPSLTLDTLLLRVTSSVGKTTRRYFPSLLSHEDEDRFMEFVNGGDGSGQSLLVRMRDDWCSLVNVQLFHQRFEDVAGAACHVIGVLEVSDAQRPSHPSPQIGAYPSGASDSSDGSDLVPLQVPQDDQLVAVWIDSTASNLRILKCTADFTNISGPLEEGAGLLDMVEEQDKASFLRWAQFLVKTEDFNEHDDASALSVRLHTQSIDVQTLCQMHHTPHAEIPWCISFSCIRRLVARRQGRQTSLSGTMARPRRRMTL